MKKLPFIIGIPAVAVALVVGGAMVWKLKTQTVDVATTSGVGTLPSGMTASGTKPSNPFSALFGGNAGSIPTPTPATVAEMNADLQTVGDDGGAADFSSLRSDAGGL